MTIAIMQPYFLPYIGYFQLINAVDKFIFYDDVNFIKNGWINRNRILINGEAKYITIQLKEASSFKQIKEIEFTDNRRKILRSIEQAYAKAPYAKSIMPLINSILTFDSNHISNLAINSVKSICNYLEINTTFELSSLDYKSTKTLERTERIKELCKLNNADTYINVIGGQELYAKQDFATENITLKFLKSNSVTYKQLNEEYIPWLSIVDVLMFNSKEDISNMLNDFYYE